MITVTINARLHEEARVASAKFTFQNCSLNALCAQVREQLAITVKWADEKDALIGHVKAYLQWGTDDAVMLSTTGAEVQVKGSELPEAVCSAEVGITAIVFGVELEELESRLEGISAAIVGQNGEWAVFNHECEHHHHDHDDECGCEHEHHHHDHDDECGCEHEHHHHDHDDECGCEHEHHHHDDA